MTARRVALVMAGAFAVYAVLVAFANLSVDLLYGFLDPRIKVGGKA